MGDRASRAGTPSRDQGQQAEIRVSRQREEQFRVEQGFRGKSGRSAQTSDCGSKLATSDHS